MSLYFSPSSYDPNTCLRVIIREDGRRDRREFQQEVVVMYAVLSNLSYLSVLVCCRKDAILLTYSYLRVLVCWRNVRYSVNLVVS